MTRVKTGTTIKPIVYCDSVLSVKTLFRSVCDNKKNSKTVSNILFFIAVHPKSVLTIFYNQIYKNIKRSLSSCIKCQVNSIFSAGKYVFLSQPPSRLN